MFSHKFLSFAVLAVLLMITLPACSAPARAVELHMLPMDQMPPAMQSAPVTVRTAYQFAVANPDVMKQIPCYCGCGSLGHTSNYSCYALQADGGRLVFDDHALGCSLCVDITQDTMRLLKEGKTVPQIRAYVDATYSNYGTSNMP